MAKVWQHLDEAPALERDLNPELIRSERSRIHVMMGVFLLLFVVAVAVSVALGRDWIALPPGLAQPPTVLLASVALLAASYEVLVLRLLSLVEDRGLVLPDPPRYANVLVEVTLVSVVLVIFAQSYEPSLALNSPAFVVYGLIVVLSTLRLSFPLGVFTGAAAGVEYAALTLHYLPPVPILASLPSTAWVPFNVGKAFFLLLSGVAAGIVAVQIRKRIDATTTLLSERARIVSTFGQYLSPAVAERLLHVGAVPGTEVRPVTIMFLDIRGFTAFSERRTPDEVVGYLNQLFGFMVECVNRNAGIINKFLGDGFMAIFGAPFSDGQDNLHAANAARDILAELAVRNGRGDFPTTRICIGIHAGTAVVGTIGSAERREYTVIGDTVNLASRVESLNKEFSSSLLVTEAVYRDVSTSHPGEPLPPVKVKGRDDEVQIYKLA